MAKAPPPRIKRALSVIMASRDAPDSFSNAPDMLRRRDAVQLPADMLPHPHATPGASAPHKRDENLAPPAAAGEAARPAAARPAAERPRLNPQAAIMALRQQGAVLAPRCHGDSSRLPALQQVPLARAALHIMYMVAAIDNDPAKVEFDRIAKIAETLPLFEKCNQGMLDQAAQECAAMVQVGAEGYERLFAIFELSVPPDVWEAVFALACDVAYGDERLRQQENKCLHVLSAEFGISADVAQMHRQSAQARYATP